MEKNISNLCEITKEIFLLAGFEKLSFEVISSFDIKDSYGSVLYNIELISTSR